LASNSLLECMVFARAAVEHIVKQPRSTPPTIQAWDDSRVIDADEQVVISHNWDELRRFMWDYVGIVRTDKRLQRAMHRVQLLQAEIAEYYGNYKVGNDLLELRNLAMVAELMIRCAISRRESRGLHYTLNYPGLLNEALDTVLTPHESALQAEADTQAP
jgi:L-aspartate oxidase